MVNICMQWKTLLESRSTQFAFADTPIDFDHIHAVVAHTVSHVPSKQLHQPYTVHIVDNTPELKLKFAEWTHRDPDCDAATDPGNPQSQAPCILMFVPNSNSTFESDYTSNGWIKHAYMEIGIVSASCNYALIDSGYACGYCGCFSEPDENNNAGKQLIAQHFGLSRGPAVIIGVGYASNSDQWWDPRTNTHKPLPLNSTGKGMGTDLRKNVDSMVYMHL